MTSLKSLGRIRSPKVYLVPGHHLLLVGDLLFELGAKENVVATWDLRRDLRDWCNRLCWLVVARERLTECVSHFCLAISNHGLSANFFFKLAH